MGTIIDLPQPSDTLLSTQHLFRNLSIKSSSHSPPSLSNSIFIPSSPGVFPLFIFLNASSNSFSVITSSSSPSTFLSSSFLSLLPYPTALPHSTTYQSTLSTFCFYPPGLPMFLHFFLCHYILYS